MKIGGSWQHWTPHQIRIAAEIYARKSAAGESRKHIVQAIVDAVPGRTFNAICHRLSVCGPSFANPKYPAYRKRSTKVVASIPNRTAIIGHISHARPPESVLAEAEYRAGLDYPTITAAFCGDPKPGYSWFDRQRRRRK